MARQLLPARVPALAELYAELGTRAELSLDVKDPQAAGPAVEVARAAGAAGHLWLCGAMSELGDWRALDPQVRLVESTRRRFLLEDLTAHARELVALDVQALNLPWREWRPADVAAVHAAGLLAFGWDAHRVRSVRAAAALGLDAVYGDDVRALARVLGDN